MALCSFVSHQFWCLPVQSFLEVWGEGATWEELLASIQAYPRERIQRWCMPNISLKVLVDGWGRAVKQEQQLDIINKFDFLGLQVQPPVLLCVTCCFGKSL